jgi:hypothetical protein
MEMADANAERRNLVDREWFRAVNGVAELLKCADRPDGLPEDPSLIAQIPTKIRAGIIRRASAFSTNADHADRLVNWNAPGTCK